MKRLVLDIETDGLQATKIHMCVTKDIDTNEVLVHYDAKDFKEYIKDATLVIGHNLIGFDHLWLARLWDCHIPREVCRDTLVLSRLHNQQLHGGHSLEAWGDRLGCPKQEHDNFDEASPELLSRCISDVHLNHKLWDKLLPYFRFPNWEHSIKLEHSMTFLCRDMNEEGFGFNEDQAKIYLSEIQALIKQLDEIILNEFKPVKKIEKVYEIRYKQDGTLHKKTAELLLDPNVTRVDETLVKYKWEEFNPQSSKQICERLEGLWTPTEKTDGHKEYLKLPKKQQTKERLEYFGVYGWKVSETNLGTLSDEAPEAARSLVKRIMLGARERTLQQWLEHSKDNILRGTFDTLGTWTHRFAHRNPNLGNVSAEKTIKYKGQELRDLAIHYGGAFRKLFTAKPGKKLVGVDMEGAHLRLFAHLINDKELIKALVSGDKKLGTDPHTINKKKLGDLCPDRDLAKTFIFTFLNGGGYGKVSEIFQCSMESARSALDGFINSYPGLVYLKEKIVPRDAERGYFIGLDGRKVPCDNAHLMIAGYLQNGEAVVVKEVVDRSMRHFKEQGLPVCVVNIVHDEIQFETVDDEKTYTYVGEYAKKQFEEVGKYFKVRCPLAGEVKYGYDWHESH